MDITYRNLNLSEVHLFWDLKKLLDQETRYMMYEPSERVKDEESLNQIEENIKSAIKKRDFLKVALNNNKLVGYLSAERGIFARNQHVAYLTIGVLKDYSGQGIAKKLFVLLDSWAKDNGWNGNSFFDKFYKVQNFFPYAIPIVLDNEPPRM
ncbi:GNAT family N-acetyltransferase [Enterococcus casseliflavus]